MSFEINKFEVVKKKKLQKTDFSVECKVTTNAEIDKVLCVKHNVCITNNEVLNGMINYSGTIDVSVIFCTIDGKVESEKTTCNFTSKFEDEFARAGDIARIKVEIENTEIQSVSNGEVKINFFCVQSGVLICKKEVDKICVDDENICKKTEEIFVNQCVGSAKEVFVVENKTNLKQNLKQMILSDSQVYVKSVESGADYVSVAGEVVSKILYLSTDDKFETETMSENFRQEIELPGTTKESFCEVDVSVLENEVKCEIDQDEKKSNVVLNIPIELKVFAYQQKQENVVSDLYGTESEIESERTKYEMTKKQATEFFEAKIDGTLTLDDDKPRVDKIMFVGPTALNLTNSYIKDEEVFVEGIAKTSVVYLNDEQNSLFGVEIEVPFVVSDKTKCENDANIEVFVAVTDVDVVVKKGREFYFDAKLKIKAEYDVDYVGETISNIEKKTDLPERDCAIQIFFAHGGQNLWDIAKSLRVKEEFLQEQNPEIVFPLEKDENIVLFHQTRS